MQSYWNKRKWFDKKKVELPQDRFGTPTWQKKLLTWQKSWAPTGFVRFTNMAAVSLFCNTNMAAICRHVHRLYTLLWCVVCFLIVKIHYYLTVRFTKLLTNGFRSSFEYSRSWQSNSELGNEVVNFTPNFVGKLPSSLREKFAPFGEIVSEFP